MSYRKRSFVFALLLVFALAQISAACYLSQQTDVHQGSTVTGPNIGASPSPSPTTTPGSGACQLPTRIRLGLGGCAGGIVVGGVCGNLNLTPFIGEVASPAVCDDARALLWRTTPTAVCRVEVVGNPYTPDVRGLAPGDCEISALVDGVISDAVIVRVQNP